mmetsp:Transcript_34699/g.30521  ORF Transcript_34699/g.30521 Transcript_34699/m.30521 type:complete len:348 (-) Transcript_34699:26-1069(-)
MGSACGANCDKKSNKPIINTANNPDSSVVKQTRRRSTNNKYRMMLNDEEILQTPKSTVISPMPHIQSPSASGENNDNPAYRPSISIPAIVNTDTDTQRVGEVTNPEPEPDTNLAAPMAFSMQQLTASSTSLDWQTPLQDELRQVSHSQGDIYANNDDDDGIYKLNRESNKLELDIHKIMDEDLENKMIKTKDGKIRIKPNLCRPDTNAPWEDFSDMEELEDEMTKQLQQLSGKDLLGVKAGERVKENMNSNLNTTPMVYQESQSDHDEDSEHAYNQNQEIKMEIKMEITKQGNNKEKERRSSITSLLRHKSVDKWDMDEMESTMNDMQKEMKHLMQNELNVANNFNQ